MNNVITKKFITFITMIVERPGMFLVENVDDIRLIIFGYKNGCSSQDSKVIETFIDGFNVFVNGEFKTVENHEWSSLIRFYGSNNKNSINLFKVTFEKYIDQK